LQLLHLEDGGPLTDNVVFASAQRVHVLKRAADLQEPVTFGGQFCFVGKTKTIEKESIERFATLTREERGKSVC